MKTPKTGAERQAEYRQRAWRENGRDRLTVMLPTASLIFLERLAKHQGRYKWEVLARLIDAAARQLPANERTLHGNGLGYK